MKTRDLVAVNCASVGASSAFVEASDESGPLPLPRRAMIAPHAWPTMIHESDEDTGHPYRVDLGVPAPIARESPSRSLFEGFDPEAEFGVWCSSVVEPLSRAVRFFLEQTAKGPFHRAGVVVPDRLLLEDTESFLRHLSYPRKRIVLLPWPMAAAWAWIDRFESQLAPNVSLDEDYAGMILCVQVGPSDLAAVPVHVIASQAGEPRDFVPARNRDRDKLRIERFEGQRFTDHLRTLLDSLQGCVGMVLCGRARSAGELEEFERLARELCANRFPSVLLTCELEYEHGLLSTGALSGAWIASKGGIPYYESIPKIELLVDTKILEDRPIPNFLSAHSGWLNCLQGIQGSVEITGGTLIPANRTLKHKPDSSSLALKAGRTTIVIAFDGRDVRSVTANAENVAVQRERGLSLQIEYQLGSGRPRLTIERAKHPNMPLLFDWAQADIHQKTRDEETPYTLQDLERLHEDRQRRREKKGWQRYSES